jgi:FkbM family methyltransferase
MGHNNIISILKKLWYQMHRLRILLGLTPFRIIDETAEGLVFLLARIKTPLARRGEVIAIPRDKMIFSYVRNYGQWGLEEAQFLVKVAKSRTEFTDSDLLLIDLGAHAGLVSKIFIDSIPIDNTKMILVDPLLENNQAQRHNLLRYEKSVEFCNMAISDFTGSAKFEVDLENIGASRLLDEARGSVGSLVQQVQTISVPDFVLRYLQNSATIILKSDLEGYDVEVINMLSDKIWERIIGGIIEIDPLSELSERDTSLLIGRLKFFNVSTKSTRSETLTHHEIASIWDEKKRTVSNLYFWR